MSNSEDTLNVVRPSGDSSPRMSDVLKGSAEDSLLRLN
jgi:hypothetical protein